jgi:hypothetical protein
MIDYKVAVFYESPRILGAAMETERTSVRRNTAAISTTARYQTILFPRPLLTFFTPLKIGFFPRNLLT